MKIIISIIVSIGCYVLSTMAPEMLEPGFVTDWAQIVLIGMSIIFGIVAIHNMETQIDYHKDSFVLVPTVICSYHGRSKVAFAWLFWALIIEKRN